MSKSSLYLFEGAPVTNAAAFFSAESDEVFESSHYKQVLDPRNLPATHSGLRLNLERDVLNVEALATHFTLLPNGKICPSESLSGLC